MLNGDNEVRKLPKLYAAVKIKFWSLRNGIGAGGGVYFDNDVQVVRKCRRVLCGGYWRWQIVNGIKLAEFDCTVYQDNEVLYECGSDLEFEYI